MKQLLTEDETWKNLLTRFLDVILFLAERGLFCGSSHLFGGPTNENYLGILELVSHYDPLSDHLEKVRKSQLEKTSSSLPLSSLLCCFGKKR